MGTNTTAAPWLGAARSALGVQEIVGPRDNPRILEMYAACGHPDIDADEVAWCAAFVGSLLAEQGLPLPPRATNLMARSYLTYGRKLDVPQPGAIAVWARGKPPSGHVNIVESVDLEAGMVTCIDGNSGNKVQRTTRRIDEALAFRWPVAATRKDLIDAGSTELVLATGLKRIAGGSIGVGTAAAAANTATAPPPPPAAVPSIAELDLTAANEHINTAQTIMEHVNELAKLAFGHPWLAGGILVSAALYWLARRWEQSRLARAAAGHSLSLEG
jgi:uncharacterized protein (TIGR02594 family)